jgi:hypothetical protein
MISAPRQSRNTYTFAIYKTETLGCAYKNKKSPDSNARKPRKENGRKDYAVNKSEAALRARVSQDK